MKAERAALLGGLAVFTASYLLRKKPAHTCTIPPSGQASIETVTFLSGVDHPLFPAFAKKAGVITSSHKKFCPIAEAFSRNDLVPWTFDWGNGIILLLQVKDFDKLAEKPFLDRGIRKVVNPGDDLVVLNIDDVVEYVKANVTLDWSKVNVCWNTGRCGSTLMHRVVEKTSFMASLSEPQWIDDVMFDDNPKAIDGDIIRTMMLLEWHFIKLRRPDVTHISLNPKGENGLLKWATTNEKSPFKTSKHFYMYRNASAVVNSFAAIFTMHMPNYLKSLMYYTNRDLRPLRLHHLNPKIRSIAKELHAELPKTYPPVRNFLISKLNTFCQWHEAMENNWIKDPIVIDFADFRDKKKQRLMTEGIFKWFGRPLSSEELDEVCVAFESNSQKGSQMTAAQAKGGSPSNMKKKSSVLSKEQMDEIESLFRKYWSEYDLPLKDAFMSGDSGLGAEE